MGLRIEKPNRLAIIVSGANGGANEKKSDRMTRGHYAPWRPPGTQESPTNPHDPTMFITPPDRKSVVTHYNKHKSAKKRAKRAK